MACGIYLNKICYRQVFGIALGKLIPLTFHNDKDPQVGVGLPLFHVEDTGELEEEEERGVKRLVLPHTQRPHVNVAPSLALSLQVLKTAHKQTNKVSRFSY